MSVTTPVVAGGTFTATIPTPPGPPAGLGARVEDPISQAILSAWQPASILGAQTFVTLDTPLAAGTFNIHWMTNGPVSTYDLYVPLVVLATSGDVVLGVDWPQATSQDVRPTASQVALLERTRTIENDTGEEAGIFTARTRPSLADAEAIIDQATDDILAELPHDAMIDPVHHPQVRRAITFYAAMLIEGSFYREQSQDRGGPLWQEEYREALSNVQARINEDYAQNNLLGTMEPRNVPGSLLA